jgi:IclR family acetate operon transcriptional repressor
MGRVVHDVWLRQLAIGTCTPGLPLPTIHRLMRTLTQRGCVRREASRRYTLGPQLVRLGDAANRAFGAWPSCDRVGEIGGGEVDHLQATDGQHHTQ